MIRYVFVYTYVYYIEIVNIRRKSVERLPQRQLSGAYMYVYVLR